jgi:hypothetical protein
MPRIVDEAEVKRNVNEANSSFKKVALELYRLFDERDIPPEQQVDILIRYTAVVIMTNFEEEGHQAIATASGEYLKDYIAENYKRISFLVSPPSGNA